MALSDKNIIITPNNGQTEDPNIVFSGADSTTGAQNVSLNMYPTSNGTLSVEASSGQLFSVSNDMSGYIFSVNDVSGMPSIDVNANGTIRLAPYGGTVRVGDAAWIEMTNSAGTAPSTYGMTPTSLQIFPKIVGGRMVLAWQGPSGMDTTAQPLIARNRVYYWAPVGLNTTTAPAAQLSATALTAVGTATARAFATTNILTRMTRMAYAQAATAGLLTSLRVAAGFLTVGDGNGLGGFTYICRFGVSDAAPPAGARMFVGVSASTVAATNVEPSTLVNSIGVAKLSTDNTQWYIVYGGSAAQTAIPLGTALGAPSLTNTVWDIALFASPNQAGVVKYQFTNVGTGVSVSGTLTPTVVGTQTPATTTALTTQMWRTNNATAVAFAMDFCSLYIETDN